MRKTVAHLFSSVDTPFRFQLDSFDEGLGNAMDRNLATVDAMLLGRVLYTEWAEYRPEATDEFGVFVNPLKKYVVSTTLTGPLEWQNSELLTGDPMEAIRALKQTEGGTSPSAASRSPGPHRERPARRAHHLGQPRPRRRRPPPAGWPHPAATPGARRARGHREGQRHPHLSPAPRRWLSRSTPRTDADLEPLSARRRPGRRCPCRTTSRAGRTGPGRSRPARGRRR